MSQKLVLVALVWVTTAALKSFGPVVFGGRELAPWFRRVADLVPAAVLAGLIAIQTATTNGALTLDARAAGVLAAAGVMAWRNSLSMAMAAAVLVTAALRLVM
ncbi:MAG TPA: AzlD domain-containing protein [Acidimicrobiia bacterium]